MTIISVEIEAKQKKSSKNSFFETNDNKSCKKFIEKFISKDPIWEHDFSITDLF